MTSFVMRSQEVSLAYEADANLLMRLREKFEGQPAFEHLNLNSLQSTDATLVFQSPTSSTTAQVTQERALLRTRYFGEYIDPKLRRPDRATYTVNKVGMLVEALAAAGATMRFLGIVTTARRSVASPEEAKQLRRDAQRAFGMPPLLTEGGPVEDFSLRASRVVDDIAFSNVWLTWFQERAFSVQMPFGVPPQVVRSVSVSDWDMPLVDEGIEFKYDRNNKFALQRGKLEWTVAELLTLVDGYTPAMMGALDRTQDALASVTGAQDGSR